MIAIHPQQAFLLHFPQFIRQCTPIHAQIVRQLLAAKWDLKITASMLGGLKGKIGQQPSSDGFGTGMENTAGQAKVLLQRNGQQIPNQLIVKIGLAAKNNFSDVEALLDRVVPQNMVVTLLQLYNTHAELGRFTHAQLAAYTHNQLRNEVLTNGK